MDITQDSLHSTSLETLTPQFLSHFDPSLHATVSRVYNVVLAATDGRIKPHLWQMQVMQSMLKGRDAVVHAGTGSGKSLTLVLGVLARGPGAIALTISPLKRLQKNQVLFSNSKVCTSLIGTIILTGGWSVCTCSDCRDQRGFRYFCGILGGMDFNSLPF